jgi:hypothetical protein
LRVVSHQVMQQLANLVKVMETPFQVGSWSWVIFCCLFISYFYVYFSFFLLTEQNFRI